MPQRRRKIHNIRAPVRPELPHGPVTREYLAYGGAGVGDLDGLAVFVPPTTPGDIVRGAHTAQQLALPKNVRLVFLPPYCPELSPIERVWRDLKDALAWLRFPTLDGQQDYIATLLRGYEAATLPSLTGYPYLIEAIHALHP